MTEQQETKEQSATRLRNCKLCGKSISPYSPFCRNCGHPQGSPLFIWLLIGFLVLLIALYLAMTLFCMCNVQQYRVYREANPGLQQIGPGKEPPREPESGQVTSTQTEESHKALLLGWSIVA